MGMMSMIGIRRTPSNRTCLGLIPLISLTILVVLAFPVLKLPDINLRLQYSRHLLLSGFGGWEQVNDQRGMQADGSLVEPCRWSQGASGAEGVE
jgi:hypothetical protein